MSEVTETLKNAHRIADVNNDGKTTVIEFGVIAAIGILAVGVGKMQTYSKFEKAASAQGTTASDFLEAGGQRSYYDKW